jgi:glycosyltransferase involved in cell wall biosynthesis
MKNLNTNAPDLQLCVVVFSYNSVHEGIEDCIDSAQLLTPHVVLVDIGSTDATVELAKKKGIPVFPHEHINYVEPVRNFGMEVAPNNWVFILDADERITPELADEIHKAVQSTEFTHYKVPRDDYFAGKVRLQHGGWSGYQMRLINKKYFKEWPKRIHSTPVIEGKMGTLKNILLHFSKRDYEEIVTKTIKFEDRESDLLFQADKPVSTPTFFRKFAGELYRRMFKWQGYKDGTIGIIESIYQAFSKTITYLYLYEKKKSRSV